MKQCVLIGKGAMFDLVLEKIVFCLRVIGDHHNSLLFHFSSYRVVVAFALPCYSTVCGSSPRHN